LIIFEVKSDTLKHKTAEKETLHYLNHVSSEYNFPYYGIAVSGEELKFTIYDNL
jgi:hypothetical protein